MERDVLTLLSFSFILQRLPPFVIIYNVVDVYCLFLPLECNYPEGRYFFLFCSLVYPKCLLQYLTRGTDDKFLLNECNVEALKYGTG